jgi:hypothetical protein
MQLNGMNVVAFVKNGVNYYVVIYVQKFFILNVSDLHKFLMDNLSADNVNKSDKQEVRQKKL